MYSRLSAILRSRAHRADAAFVISTEDMKEQLPSQNISVPKHYRLTYKADEIQAQVSRIAGEVSRWCASSNITSKSDVLAIPVLRGGIYFFADLTREIDCSLQVAPGRARAYEEGSNTSTRSELYINLDGVSVAGRHVLLVDDICDSGRTLDKLVAYLLAQGAESVKSAVLILRKHGSSAFTPDWYGFGFTGDDWFVGYGMDDKGRYSNLSQIYTVRPE